MLHVCCVRWGEAFGVEYVERLYDMVRRNLPDGFAGRFVCFTDRPADLSHLPGIATFPLTEGLEGWWNKLEMFKPGEHFTPGDRVWYFDLDTVITGPLEMLFNYPGAFGILEDVYRKGGFQSAVMSWIAGTPLVDSIWDEWVKQGRPRPDGGDQRVLELFWREWLPRRIQGAAWLPDFLQELYRGVLCSYKVSCVWVIPKGTSVVFFHGRPRPHEVKTGWVPEVWKVGGGTSHEFVSVGTIPQERLLEQVKDALGKRYTQLAKTEPHDQYAVICGGGPSLADHLQMVQGLQEQGAVLFALNNTDTFLRDRGITPNFHVMLDGREELAKWVNPGGIKLFASMSHPRTLELASQVGELVVWHALTAGVEEIIQRKAVLIGGGETVGIRAMALAYVMGFRRMMLFGFDSSFRQGAHHVYDQALNDGDRALDCVVAGERFKAAPWMIKQADDFKELSIALMGMGCEIAVTGDGLIAAVVRGMNSATVEVDGMLWPSRDTQARGAILGTVSDLEHFIGLCTNRRIAIQAGGNVGVWPKELAKHFGAVFTFEPDSINFECLNHNVREENVHKRYAALGAVASRGAIARDPQNCGASQVAVGDEFEVVTIDSLNLDHVDLIQLDVEGFELQALRGAVGTIIRCSPLIVLELKGLGEQHGYTDQHVDDFLATFHYERIGVAHRDVIFKRKNHE